MTRQQRLRQPYNNIKTKRNRKFHQKTRQNTERTVTNSSEYVHDKWHYVECVIGFCFMQKQKRKPIEIE